MDREGCGTYGRSAQCCVVFEMLNCWVELFTGAVDKPEHLSLGNEVKEPGPLSGNSLNYRYY